jgi:predicted RNA-binding protein YlqC (UPF0109 family)
MVLNILKKALGIGAEAKPQVPENDEARLAEFVRYVVTNLVDTPAKVDVSTAVDNDILKITIACDKPDIGKVIGRRGKTIASIRALASGAGRRSDQKVTVEVLD